MWEQDRKQLCHGVYVTTSNAISNQIVSNQI